MHSEYDDIKSRIPEPPAWYDENGCPRYGAFTPMMLSDIYADECVLLEIGCQGCALTFHVAISSSTISRVTTLGRRLDAQSYSIADARVSPEYERGWNEALAKVSVTDEEIGPGEIATSIRGGQIHYGDPPNHIDTDHAGSTMNSVPRRVLEYWTRNIRKGWDRDATLEVALEETDQ